MRPFAAELVRAAGAAGLLPRVTSTTRTYAEQSRLYRRFVAGAAQYPVAPPGTSAHEYGYAMDMVVSPMDALPDVADYWQQLGGIWHFSDAVHFEFPGFKDDLASGVARPLSPGPPALLAKAADIVAGGGTASIVDALAGGAIPVVHQIANPVEALQPLVDEFTRAMRELGLLY